MTADTVSIPDTVAVAASETAPAATEVTVPADVVFTASPKPLLKKAGRKAPARGRGRSKTVLRFECYSDVICDAEIRLLSKSLRTR